MGKRLKHDTVAKSFAAQGCVLLDRYTGCKTKMRFRCSCGREGRICYSAFRLGVRCGCRMRRPDGSRPCGTPRKDPLLVEKAFADAGCRLLEPYRNGKTKMRYVCSCGRRSRITWNHFRTGVRCGCRGLRNALKYDRGQVASMFAERGCTLLATEYTPKAPMPFTCKCGRYAEIRLDDLLKGKRCKGCYADRIEQGVVQRRWKGGVTTDDHYGYIRGEFTAAGCTLLATEYRNAITPMPWQCSCGNANPPPITWNKFQGGHRCRQCGPSRAKEKRLVATAPWTEEVIDSFLKLVTTGAEAAGAKGE